jgi:hypothetical protein
MVLSQRLHEALKGAVERMTGPRTVSAFKEKGVLTPDEFVEAGDNLVSKCPTWSWYLHLTPTTVYTPFAKPLWHGSYFLHHFLEGGNKFP